MSFHPYLFFDGNCRDAFTRYQEIFGGELQLITAADMPADEQMPGASPDAIMHAALMSDGQLLMGSDDPTAERFSVQGMQVNASLGTVDEAKRVFEALADGGEIQAPFGPTSWAAGFGMCTDRFGTPWMVGTDGAPEPA
jgi:PhnB protein